MARMSFEELREQMVTLQLAGRGIADPLVLAAFRAVPRESFVPADLAEFAFDEADEATGRFSKSGETR